MARFSSTTPIAGVYLVKLVSIASRPAALIASGVAKAGSPAPKSMTSTPSRRSRSTVAVTFMVGELEMRGARPASFTSGLRRRLCGDLPSEARFDHVRHEAVHAPAEGEDFFDQARADVGVLLG